LAADEKAYRLIVLRMKGLSFFRAVDQAGVREVAPPERG
jgi:hypothetical protein